MQFWKFLILRREQYFEYPSKCIGKLTLFGRIDFGRKQNLLFGKWSFQSKRNLKTLQYVIVGYTYKIVEKLEQHDCLSKLQNIA